MGISQKKSNSIAILRQKAEKLLKNNISDSDLVFSAQETLHLLHELEVYQLELEMQNEELMQAQTLAQNAVDLYNYAPNGYFTLSPTAEIIDLNDTGADLLKKEKLKLIGSSFCIYVTGETKPIFTNFMQKVLHSKNRADCEITLSLSENFKIFVQLIGVVNKTGKQCLVTIIDITEKKQAEAIIQQEREFYKDLVNNQPAGIYRIRVFSKEKWGINAWESSKNPPYKMELASDRFCEILGITHSEFEVNTAIISDLIHPQDKYEFSLKNEEANSKIISFKWEGRLIIHDKIIWVHFESFPRPLENGDILWSGIIYDISERKQAELALKESDERFQLLFNKAPLGYQSLDIEGDFIEVNQQWLDILGFTREEVIGKWFGDFLSLDYKDGFRKRFPIFKAQGHIHSEFEMVHKNGTKLFIAFDGRIGYDANGDFMQTHCILQDITESNRTKIALRESEEKFRNTFENSILGMSLTSIDGKLSVNKAFCDIIGYSENELKQLNWKEITHKDDVELNQKVVQSILKGEKDSERWEKRYIHKNGNIVWSDISTSLQRDKAGNPLFFITSINDITDRKRAEKELKESREQFKDLFENAPVGYHEIDVEGKIVRMNKTELDMLGYSADEVIGQFFWEFAPEKTITKQSISAKLKGDAILDVPFEREFCRKDGTKIPVLIQDVMLRDSDGNILGIRSTVQDITERKKWEEALLHSEDKFKKAFMTSPDCFTINRLEDGMYVAINNGFTKIVGYTEEDIIGKTSIEKNIWYDLIDRKRWVDELKKNGKVDNFVARFRTKKGEIIYGLVSSTFIELDGIKHVLSITRDITEIKKTELALQQSEERFKVLFEDAPDSMFLADPATSKIVDANNAACRLFKKEKNELIGLFQYELHPNQVNDFSKDTFNDQFKQTEQPGTIHPVENSILCSDGTEIPVEILGQSIRIGENVLMLGTFRDITERKKAQDELIEREVQYHNLANSGTALIWAAGLDKLCFYFNEPWLKFTGRKLEQELGNGWTEGVHPDDFDQCLNTYVTSFDKRIAFEMEYRMRNAEGEYRWILDLGKPNYNGASEFIGYIGHCFDITERKNTEKSLQESEKKLSALFTSMTEMVVIHELVLNEIGEAIDYRIIDCNDTFTQITGIEKENANGKLATEVYQTNRAPYLEEYTKVCITGESMEYKTYYAPMDKHFLISAVSTGINQFATITTDITAIQKTQEIITEKNKELENYIYVASHDLRSPLVNIQGFTQRLERQVNELKRVVLDNIVEENIKSNIEKITNEEIPKSVNFILSNVMKMDTLINGLLQLSRTGRIVMTIRKIDMNKLLKSILSAHNYELTEIEANVLMTDLADCYGDENQLNQLFSNIINNAIKYRDKSRQFHLKISSQDFFNRVVYSVKDSGVGINARHLEKIWDVFYRVDSSSPEAGEGIGLSLARRIVDKHEGKIWAESVEGKGSTFYIELHRDGFGE